jgi:hypothetical protein
VSTDNPTPKPTIEERLEAVVQTLELVAAMHRDHEKQLAESNERWNQRFAESDQRWDKRFDKVMDGIELLTNVAKSHERRLSDLERPRQ